MDALANGVSRMDLEEEDEEEEEVLPVEEELLSSAAAGARAGAWVAWGSRGASGA